MDAGENRQGGRQSHRAAIGIQRTIGGIAIHALGRQRTGQGGDIQAARELAGHWPQRGFRRQRWQSADGMDGLAVSTGATTFLLATFGLSSLLNKARAVSSKLLPVMPSNATSAMEATAPQSPPYKVSPAIFSTGSRCSPVMAR